LDSSSGCSEERFPYAADLLATGFHSSSPDSLAEVSLYADHHFTSVFDAHADIAYSDVTGGPAFAIPHGPQRPLLLQQQHRADSWGSFHFLIDFRGLSGRSEAVSERLHTEPEYF
jgi:hypothetical protein